MKMYDNYKISMYLNLAKDRDFTIQNELIDICAKCMDLHVDEDIVVDYIKSSYNILSSALSNRKNECFFEYSKYYNNEYFSNIIKIFDRSLSYKFIYEMEYNIRYIEAMSYFGITESILSKKSCVQDMNKILSLQICTAVLTMDSDKYDELLRFIRFIDRTMYFGFKVKHLIIKYLKYYSSMKYQLILDDQERIQKELEDKKKEEKALADQEILARQRAEDYEGIGARISKYWYMDMPIAEFNIKIKESIYDMSYKILHPKFHVILTNALSEYNLINFHEYIEKNYKSESLLCISTELSSDSVIIKNGCSVSITKQMKTHIIEYMRQEGIPITTSAYNHLIREEICKLLNK